MPASPKVLCDQLVTQCNGKEGEAWFREMALSFLCNIASGGGYNWGIVCDADTGVPLIVRALFNSDGTLSTDDGAIRAFYLTGEEYTGDFDRLLSCGGDGGDGSGGALLEASFDPEIEILFGAINPSWSQWRGPAGNLVYLLIANETDAIIEISFDAGVSTHATLNPQESRRYDFASNRRKMSAGIYGQYVTSAATTGKVRIESYT